METTATIASPRLRDESIYLAQASSTGETAGTASSQPREVNGAWGGWRSRFVRELPNGSIAFDGRNNRAPSEGMGYGMYIALQTGDQGTFNSLLNGLSYFSKPNNLFYAYVTSEGNMPARSDAIRNPDASAADADIYIASSLIQAHNLVVRGRWTAPQGASYLQRAQQIMNAIWENDIIERGGRLIIKPSDHDWPVWGDGRVAYNPSYFAPAMLRFFASHDSNPAHNWNKVIQDGYDLMNVIMENSSSLDPKGQNPIPDWVLVSASGGNFRVESYNRITPDNEYDAIRVPIEIGRDAILNGDRRAVDFLRRFVNEANVRDNNSVKVGGWSNEIAWSCYGVAVRGAGDPRNTLQSFRGSVRSSFHEDYFGFSQNDANDYYKQSVVLLASMLLF